MFVRFRALVRVMISLIRRYHQTEKSQRLQQRHLSQQRATRTRSRGNSASRRGSMPLSCPSADVKEGDEDEGSRTGVAAIPTANSRQRANGCAAITDYYGQQWRS